MRRTNARRGRVVDASANLAVAQAVAEQGAVLLKNDGQLPLPPGLGSIAIIGPHADIGVLSGGGSADVIPIGGSALVEPSPVFPFPVRWLPSSPLLAIGRLPWRPPATWPSSSRPSGRRRTWTVPRST